MIFLWLGGILTVGCLVTNFYIHDNQQKESVPVEPLPKPKNKLSKRNKPPKPNSLKEKDFCRWVVKNIKANMNKKQINRLIEEWDVWGLNMIQNMPKFKKHKNYKKLFISSITPEWKKVVHILDPKNKKTEDIAVRIRDECYEKWIPEGELDIYLSNKTSKDLMKKYFFKYMKKNL